ncbi:MAG: c-type cytochrome [Planctomycetaceae bacterium]
MNHSLLLRRCGVAAALVFGFTLCGIIRSDDAPPKSYTQAPEVMPAQVQGVPVETPKPAPVNWTAEPNPEWIWGIPGTKPCVVKTTFAGGAKTAWIKATCDNVMKLTLNGQSIASSSEWQQPVEVDVLSKLKPGDNELVAELDNEGGASGFLLKLVMQMPDGMTRTIVTGGDWTGAATKDASDWQPVRVIASYGAKPWGDVLAKGPELAGGVPRDVFQVLPGFQVEKLYTVPKEELGSWVCITVDPKGRIIASDQGDKGLCRITPPPQAQGLQPLGLTTVERLPIDISAAQGLLFAFGHLYISVNGGPGSGLYRAKYDEAADTFGTVEKLHEFRGGGEHGPHALRLSPDGKRIYVIAGNHTRPPFEPIRSGEPQTMGGVRSDVLTATLPEGMTSRMLPNWDEDLLLPREWDARGHARGILAPGGWIASTDPEGKTWDLFSTGYRNPYDMAFNADGELFAYDADMEWDMGMPWYRPTRVVHATSGSEFGWRSGTGKWPTYYLDSLPPVVNIGPGSPVGVEFGYGTKFPAKYQKALFLCDWTFGTMYAIHLTPEGSSYTGVKEEFVSRTPLPLTDCAVGKDGALYFTVGGRGTQSELFRVTYVGDESTDMVDGRDLQFAESRALRHTIETLHTEQKDPATAESGSRMLLDGLINPDRFIRFATLVGYEHLAAQSDSARNGARFDKPVTTYPPDIIFLSTVMLARLGFVECKGNLLDRLSEPEIQRLPERFQLDHLRALSLLFVRLGAPNDDQRQALLKVLESSYPSKSTALNRELSQMLVFLQSPTVVEKTVKLLQQPTPQEEVTIDPVLARNSGYGGTITEMLRNQPDVERIWLAFVLREAKVGWTVENKKQFYQFLTDARQWKGGASFQGFLSIIDNEVWDATDEKTRIAIEGAGLRKPFQLPELPKPQGPGHQWTLDEVLANAGTGLEKGRDFKNGQRAFAAARCIVCHRFAGDGGATGPDLTQLAGRFNLKDLSEAIIDPSKVISDQYKATTIVTDDGKTYTGRVLGENDQTLSVLIDPEDSSKVVDIPKKSIETQQPAATSLMPNDLLKPLNENEVLDLLAYLLSRGDETNRMFKKK